MATAERVQSTLRARPGTVTAALSVVGYVLVGTALTGTLPLFPPLSDRLVQVFSHAIAAVNALALTAILAGVYFIRNREYRKHRAAMLTAFGLIMLFLVLYLWKTGGGFEKSITATGLPKLAYLLMLAVHIILSVVSVPVVLYAVILGLTHSVEELEGTVHARVGRVAATAWAVSLFLGIVTYLLLNHVYGWNKREVTAALLLVAVPRLRALRRP